MVVNINDLEFGDRASGVTPNCKKQKLNKYTQIQRHTYKLPTAYFITMKSFMHQKTQNGKATCKPYTEYYSNKYSDLINSIK